MAFTSYKAERHPETNELSALQKAEWYLQGRENVYLSVLRLAHCF